jgi:hypothetical protein
MQIEYTAQVKNQKDNPFYKFRSRDKVMLEKLLEDRLLFICQLGSSKQELDREVYKLLANTASKKDFGSAPHYNNQPNTGLAALAGAVDKLRRGDLSQKQIDHIAPTLEVLAKAYPHKFCSVTFVEKEMAQINIPFNELFEMVHG